MYNLITTETNLQYNRIVHLRSILIFSVYLLIEQRFAFLIKFPNEILPNQEIAKTVNIENEVS